MKIYGKAVASIASADDEKFGPNGGFTAVLSTPSEDRDFEELKRNEWIEPLQERYPFDMDHGMTVADTIGSYVPYFDGEKMFMDTYWASTPKAQEARTLVNEGHIRNVSVAFMTHKTKKSNNEPFREMLNAGLVAVPSNRDAVILASKAADALRTAFSDTTEGEVPDEVKAAVLEALGTKEPAEVEGKAPAVIYVDVVPRIDMKAFEEAVKAGATASGVGGDGALVQAIHDASSHLGAACPVIEVTDEGDGASSGANKSAEPGVTTFFSEDGQGISFPSHVEARAFFADMIESIDSAESGEETLVEVRQATDEKSDLEAFEKSLDQVLTPDESTPEAPAPTDEVPAPASPADEKAKRKRALALMQLSASA